MFICYSRKNSETLIPIIEDFFYRTYLLDEIHISIHESEKRGKSNATIPKTKPERIEKLITIDNSPLSVDVDEYIRKNVAHIKGFNNPDDAIKYIPTLQNTIYKFANTYMLFNNKHIIDYIKIKLQPLF